MTLQILSLLYLIPWTYQLRAGGGVIVCRTQNVLLRMPVANAGCECRPIEENFLLYF